MRFSLNWVILDSMFIFRGVIIWSWCSRHFHWRLRTADCSASQINFHDSSRRTWVAPTWSRLKICLCILRLKRKCNIFCHVWIFWDFWCPAKTLYRVAFTKTNKSAGFWQPPSILIWISWRACKFWQFFDSAFATYDGSMCSMGPSHIAIMPPPISGPNASSPWDKQKRSAIVPVLVESTKKSGCRCIFCAKLLFFELVNNQS